MSSANVIDNADPLLRIPPKALQPKTHKEIRGLKKILLHRYYQHHASRDEKSYIYKKWKKIKEVQNQPTHAEPLFLTTSKDSRSIEDFECLNKVDEGTFGVVIRARDKLTDDIVALKLLKHLNEREGFSVAAQRELNTLLNIQHPNIVAGRDIAVGSTKDNVYIVMEYVPHQLKTFLETMRLNNLIFFPEHVKCLMTQLLKAVQHLHDNHIIHRDLKTANILLSQDGVLKVADFGLAREYGFPLQQYTPGVCTLWYRAPELLLLSPEYYSPVDMWSVGCIFAELVNLQPLFPATSEVDLLRRIFMDLGTPSDAIWPGYSSSPPVTNVIFENYPPGGLRKKLSREVFSDSGLSLLEGLLTYYPARRLTAAAALEHAYFKEQPVAIEPANFPVSLHSDSGHYSAFEIGEDRGSYYNTPLSRFDNDEHIVEVMRTSVATESL